MSRQPQRASPDRKESTGELAELERAATALRARFLDQFRKKRDSDAKHFYQSMAISPTRFRVMTLSNFSPPYRYKTEDDQDDFEATIDLRQIFGEHIDSFCGDLPEFVKWFVDELFRIRHDIDWIEREAGMIWPLLEEEYPAWVQIACEGRSAGQDWRAPGWLDKWPEELSPKALLSAARRGRLDADRTAVVLKVVGNRIRKRLAPVQESALADLRIGFAKAKEAARQVSTAETLVEPHREPRAAKEIELTDREKNIWTVIQRGSKGRLYCRELDGASIRIQNVGIWKGAPPTYTAAYDAGNAWRPRIENEKYKIKQKAKLAKLAP